MSRHLILGTAGHIDHGKTALVRALTGVDTDRLPEEKSRGITIDIGFARLQLGDNEIGLVDVPGHEKFIKNMLAGASGLDMAMLLVAADDSVMPQTREHFEILQLLGLRHGLIAISKCDLAADETWLELVEEEIREMVAGSFLEGAPIVRTSAETGQGIEELKEQVVQLAEQVEGRGEGSFFRVAVDRSFAVEGHGTVITGSVWSGSLSVGDEIEWLPLRKPVRVRGIQNHERSVESIGQGQRGAINLGGVHHSEIERGHEIATPGYLLPSRVLTVRLHCLSSSHWKIKHRSHLRLHVGTAERMASVSLLESNSVAPGEWALAQLFLDDDVDAVWGQPFVVRTESPMFTVGGGQVLQPVPHRIRRRNVDVIEMVRKLWSDQPIDRVRTAISFYGTKQWDPVALVRDAGVEGEQLEGLLSELEDQGELIELTLQRTRKIRVAAATVNDLEDRISRSLQRFHDENPLHATVQRQRLIAAMDYLGDDQLVQAMIDRMIHSRIVVGADRVVALKSHTPKLSGSERKLRAQILELYEKAEYQPPDFAELQKKAVARSNAVKDLVELCAAEGLLVLMSGQVYLHVKWEEELRRRVISYIHENEGMTISQMRDVLSTTRKFALPFCEYLDTQEVTKRDGDIRTLGNASDAASRVNASS